VRETLSPIFHLPVLSIFSLTELERKQALAYWIRAGRVGSRHRRRSRFCRTAGIGEENEERWDVQWRCRRRTARRAPWQVVGVQHEELSGRRHRTHLKRCKFCAFTPSKQVIVHQFDQTVPVSSSLLNAPTDRRQQLNAVFVSRTTNAVTRDRIAGDFICIYCLKHALSDHVFGICQFAKNCEMSLEVLSNQTMLTNCCFGQKRWTDEQHFRNCHI
jgi:hypothetical protein